MALIAIAISAGNWVLDSKQLDSNVWLPVLFPPLGLLKFSVAVGPMLGAAATIAACFFWFRCRPVPVFPVLFLCFAPIVFVAPLSAAVRILIILLAINLCVFLEAKARSLPPEANYILWCFLFVVFCYYMFVTSLFAGAYV